MTIHHSAFSLFVPGRLCLFGEHSDWAGELRATDPSLAPGSCLVAGTDQGITATVEGAAEFELTSAPIDGRPRASYRVAMDGAALRAAAARGDFFSYAAGVAAELWERFRVPGVRIREARADLPVARGLSSSAAICVLTARAFNRVHGLGLSVRDEMEFAYRGELAAGSQCGRMDQACAYGQQPVHLQFDAAAMRVAPVSPRAALHVLIVDLRHEKETRRILADLHACFTAPADPRCAPLRAALGTENLRLTAAARTALEAGDARTLGELMTEAQAIFDRDVAPACRAELTAPRLHAVLAHPAARELTWGGKGVGSQGDGAAQFVCRGPDERAALSTRLTAECAVHCLPLTIEANAECSMMNDE